MEREEFTDYYKKYYARLLNTSLRITSSREFSEEIVNDTLIKLFYKDVSTLSIEQTELWLHRSCINGSIDYIRHKKRETFKFDQYEANEKEEKMAEQGWSTFFETETSNNSEKIEKIKKAVEKLKDGYKIVLTLHLFEGYDYDEIAEILKIKNVSVRSQYIRAKVKLLELLNNG